jgi:membrane protein implicated in regulation of membrane protease activity
MLMRTDEQLSQGKDVGGSHMWSHLWLAIPVVGLGLFFVLPFSWALTLYVAVVLLSSLIYYKVMESKAAQVTTGAEALIGKVVTTDASGCIHYQGEWWTTVPSLPNQTVRVVARRDLRLQVEPASTLIHAQLLG